MLTIICKVTFTLLPDTSAIADDQDPPNEADDHWDDDESRSLYTASDLVPFKRRADVSLVGHAYAPRMRRVSSLVARLIVGSVDKAIEVHADRVWMQDGRLREAAPFVKMPLRWERAAGGPGTSNPVGVRPDARPDRYGQVTIPNLQPPGLHVARPEDAIAPMGFGPIAPWWPTRWEKLYRHAGTWDHRTWTERPLPEDIDAAFFNSAPLDQQTDELRSDERIVLENLHAEHARLVTNLPGIRPRALITRARSAAEEVRLRCDTLAIDTDRGVCNLVWRGQVMLAAQDEVGRVEIVPEGAPAADAAATVVGGLGLHAALPFMTKEGASDDRVPSDPTQTMTLPMTRASLPVLPFRDGASPFVVGSSVPEMPSAEPPRRSDDVGTGTVVSLAGLAGMALPFGAQNRVDPTPEPSVQRPAALLNEPLHSVPSALLPGSTSHPVAPPLIGPLATPKMIEQHEMRRLEELATVGTPVETAAPPPEAPQTRLPLEEYPVERCAAIAASMARRSGDRARILEENHLLLERWEALQRYWADAIRDELARGSTERLGAYDGAYVARLEEERGPIRADEFARLTVALERARTHEVLAELGLPEAAMMPLQRVWLDRLIDDDDLAAHVNTALEVARQT